MGRKATDENGGSSDRHKTPRTPIQFPVAWAKIARQLARDAKQPTMWYLIALLEEEAKKKGEAFFDLEAFPIRPWEEEGATRRNKKKGSK